LKSNALKINDKDNVAIAMHDIGKGEAVVVNGERLLEAADDVAAGHKIALASIDTGGKVYRYGEPIVEATCAVNQGEWVHVHNTQPIPGELEDDYPAGLYEIATNISVKSSASYLMHR